MTTPLARHPCAGLLDASMIYLHEHDLERAVSDALVKVVNERADDPRERLSELLLSDGAGGAARPASRRDAAAIAKLHAQLAKLEAENGKLRVRAEASEARQKDLEERDSSLTAANELLTRRCEQARPAAPPLTPLPHGRPASADPHHAAPCLPPQLEERGRELDRWMREALKQSAAPSPKTTPAPPAPKAGSRADLAAASRERAAAARAFSFSS